MNTTDFLIPLEQFALQSSLTLAEAWLQALEPALVESGTAVSLPQLHALARRLLALARTSPLNVKAIRQLGNDVAHQCGIQPAVLSITQQLLAQQLTATLNHEQIGLFQTHTQAILGELAAGFLQASQEMLQAASPSPKATLQQNETWFRAILSAANDGIIAVDEQQQICFANRASEALFGYQPGKLIGKNLRQLLPERARAKHVRHIQYFGETGVTARSMQRQMIVYGRHASGQEIPLKVAISQIELAGHKYYTAILHDATEHSRIDAALQKTQKLESLGIFASGIAHDFNNLLIALMAESEIASRKMPPSLPARQNIQHIMQIAERGATLTQQLLAYSGDGPPQIILVNFNQLVADNRNFLEAMLPKNITLTLNLKDGLPPIEANTGQIQQVVMNLITNAAEAYEGQPGTVEIETRLKTIDSLGFWQEAAQQIQPGQYICLRVSDQGHGMNEETLIRIFDPFFTTKVSGRGLGLAAIQGIIRNHYGAMHVTSQVGQGTTFQVLFPVSDTHDLTDKMPAHKSPAQIGHILFVDDEDIVRCAITEILELNGNTVLQARNGNDGLALFRQFADDINLVLLDRTMPIMAGDEVLQTIRKTHPNVPVLMLSGYDEPEATKQTAVTQFLKKPFKMDTLLAYINEMLS
ncbi:MAG: PAS domain S-box protein [Ardenticatenaceae bacterium]|nr:PAS domain S-box protein [Anaerolineales bacterium]MCB8923298.1 PAS domain S-box protein [Ardenticatenaceae bacterium]MCB8992038.1 PAS domain S-box protein [Ardenticatenaceae bacterium]MCB9004703.1 PAS domain S-box protein [Ardenticatenaceae bacterium]